MFRKCIFEAEISQYVLYDYKELANIWQKGFLNLYGRFPSRMLTKFIGDYAVFVLGR